MTIKQCGIYKILNIITRDYYLGSAVNIHVRWGQHRRKLRKNIHGKNTDFQNAWNKYGEQAFEFSIFLLCDIGNLLYYEDVLLKGLKPAYNIATDAFAPMRGRHHSEEARRRIGEAQMGHECTEETRAKTSRATMGRVMSEATKRRMSDGKMGHIVTEETKRKIGRKGELHYNFGKHHTEETKQKMSEANMRNMFGKHHSEETKLKMSETRKKKALSKA